MIIDFHSEFFPTEYISELGRLGAGNNFDVTIPRSLWNYLAEQKSFIDLKTRIKDMNENGIDMQVIGIPIPGVDNVEPKQAVTLAKMVNDSLAGVVNKHPDRFTALAVLPMLAADAAVDELNRAVKDLGLRGAKIFSNVAGKPIDSPEFWPIYEMASQLDVPIFIHPTNPIATQAIKEYGLTAILGFPLDTTLAIARLIFSGVLEKYQNLKLVLAHLGGTIPFLVERMDGGYRRTIECRKNINKPPSEYLGRVYLDTVSFYEPALRCAYTFWGADKLLLGSDYPYWWWAGNLKRVTTSILELDLAGKEKILGENSANLLKIR